VASGSTESRGGKPKSEKSVLWRVLAGLVIPFLNIVGRYDIRGLERLPKQGPFIFTPNHNSNLDPLVTAYVVWKSGRVPRFLVKANLFKVPVFGAILRGTGQVPVERAGRSATNSLSAASRLVENGHAVVVYPEGTLTRDPDLWPMRGKSGAVRLALEHGIPIYPCAHWGVQRILPTYGKRMSFFPRKQVEIVIGEPVDLSAFRDRPRDGPTLTAATLVVMQAVTALLEGLRDEKAPVERWDPADHGQTEFGRPTGPAEGSNA
jgi:1-acyl-sn-glycerol-3-phosphate acyltransferase